MRRLLFLLTTSVCALEVEPWFPDIWEFRFTPSYTYSNYPRVQNGRPHHQPFSNDNFLAAGLGFSPLPSWNFDVDIEFADTPKQAMGYRSSGYQARYQWMNDCVGDLATVTTGINLRGVSRHSLKDPSCPYHSDFNVEITGAIGKEWGDFAWTVRPFGFAAIGQANHGFPWIRFLFSIDGTQSEKHRFGALLEGYFGFGPQQIVHINHFHGYGSIGHQSLDATLRYAYLFDIWGRLGFAYTRRLYAHSFPESVNFFTLTYMLPFSFF